MSADFAKSLDALTATSRAIGALDAVETVLAAIDHDIAAHLSIAANAKAQKVVKINSLAALDSLAAAAALRAFRVSVTKLADQLRSGGRS